MAKPFREIRYVIVNKYDIPIKSFKSLKKAINYGFNLFFLYDFKCTIRKGIYTYRNGISVYKWSKKSWCFIRKQNKIFHLNGENILNKIGV